MATVNVYLTFDGNCEEAFLFYQSVFGGEISYIGRFKDMPVAEGCDPLPADQAEKIMHISLPISKETMLMGADLGGEWASSFTPGNNYSIMVGTDSREEADRIFLGLSEGGVASMPMQDAFWGDYFGMCSDKFGIQWMINFDPNRTAE